MEFTFLWQALGQVNLEDPEGVKSFNEHVENILKWHIGVGGRTRCSKNFKDIISVGIAQRFVKAFEVRQGGKEGKIHFNKGLNKVIDVN